MLKNVQDYINKDGVVSLCQELVRIPSVSSPKTSAVKEETLARFIGKTMEQMGMSVHYVEQIKGRTNVVGKLKGSARGPVLLMHTHIDTVDPGNMEDWMYDPFEAKVVDGRIYGRGSYDSKGGMAAMISAVKALIDANVKLDGDIVLLGEVGEEDMEECGMPFVIDNYILPKMHPDMAVYCHPRDELRLSTNFKSLTWWNLETIGKGTHAGYPNKGKNALSMMFKVARLIEEKGLRYDRHPVLGDCTMAFTTMEVTPNHYNTVPNKCRASLNIRLVPGQTIENVKNEMERLIKEMKLLDDEFIASINLVKGENPVVLNADDPIVQFAQEAVCEVVGKKPELSGEIGSGDLWHILKHGIPGIALGQGGTGNMHGPNEFIDTDQLETITRIYAKIIQKACS